MSRFESSKLMIDLIFTSATSALYVALSPLVPRAIVNLSIFANKVSSGKYITFLASVGIAFTLNFKTAIYSSVSPVNVELTSILLVNNGRLIVPSALTSPLFGLNE